MIANFKLILFSLAVLGLSAVPISVQARRLTQAQQLHNDLTRKHNAYQAAIGRLQAALQNPQDHQLRNDALSRPLAEGGEYVLVPVDIFRDISWQLVEAEVHFDASHHDYRTAFKLSRQAINLLHLTADEANRLQGILTEMKGRIDDYHRAAVREVTPEQFKRKDPYTQFNFTATQGKLTIYEIPPMDEERRTSLRQWFAESIFNAIGTDRAKVVMSGPAQAVQFWLNEGQYMFLAFLTDNDGRTEWRSSPGSGLVYRGSSDEAVPPEWAHLFEEPKAPLPATDAVTP